MKVIDLRVSGAEKGVYVVCACRRRFREPVTADEARCPACGCVGEMDSLIAEWAWSVKDEEEG